MALKSNSAGVLPGMIHDNGIRIPITTTNKETGSNKKTSGSGGGGGGGSGGGGMSGTAITANFQALLNQLYKSSFASNPIAYDQLTQAQINDQTAAWLRPNYDQAIYNRSLNTNRANAELDADAIARGMGASSYVTDVKARNFRDEAKDIALLESEYGATLAKNVAERLDAERQRALEVDMFNKEQEQADYQMAYDAATVLFKLGGRPQTLPETLDGSLNGRMNGDSNNAAAQTVATPASAQTASKGGVTSAANCATFLARLTPAQRAGIYNGTDAQSMAYRNEILASVGPAGFLQLQNRYLAG